MSYKDRYSETRPLDITITPSEAQYTANDVVGGLLTLSIFEQLEIMRGLVLGAIVSVGEASVAVPGTIHVYNEAPAVIADNAAFAATHADNKKRIGKILLPTAEPLNSFNTYDGMLSTPFPFFGQTLYANYVTSGTPNFTGAAQLIGIRFLFLGER
jgi:hypothetical protein